MAIGPTLTRRGEQGNQVVDRCHHGAARGDDEVLDLQVDVDARFAVLAHVGPQPEAAQPERGGEADHGRRAGVELLPVEHGDEQPAGADRVVVAGAQRPPEAARLPARGYLLRRGQRPRVDDLDQRRERGQQDVRVPVPARIRNAEWRGYVAAHRGRLTGAMDENALERIEAEARRSLFQAAPERLVTRMGIHWAEIGTALCTAVESAPTSRELNLAIGAEPTIMRQIERFYAGRGVSWSAAVRRDTPLERRLLNRSYVRDYAWVKFGRGPEPAAPVQTELRVEVADERFGDVVQERFRLPESMSVRFAELPGRAGWHCFMALSADRAVASGALFVNGDAAWLGFGATVPAFRRQGAHQALLAKRIDVAREAGCTTLATETGERITGRTNDSYNNILNAGYGEAYVRANLQGPKY
jgi:GNAT superfamily N-acetyltransferase